MLAASQECSVPQQKAPVLLPPQSVIKSLYTLLSASVTLGIYGYVLSFYSGTEMQWNEGDQPENRCQSQSDLPIPDTCGNTFIIKSLSSLLTLAMIKLLWRVYNSVTASIQCDATYFQVIYLEFCPRQSEFYSLQYLLSLISYNWARMDMSI